jgi:hypothetical protein
MSWGGPVMFGEMMVLRGLQEKSAAAERLARYIAGL